MNLDRRLTAGVVIACLILGAGLLGWRQAVRTRPAPKVDAPARSGLLTDRGTGGALSGAVGTADGRDKHLAASDGPAQRAAATARAEATRPTEAATRTEATVRTGAAVQPEAAARTEATARTEAPSRAGGRSDPVHRVVEGETLFRIAKGYGVSTAAIQQANGLASDLIRPGQLLLVPGGKGGTSISLSGTFTWPLLAPISSSFGPRWGRNHNGIDLAANPGDQIRASREGEVWVAGAVPGYGETVIIQHADGSRTLYGHASKLLLRAGEQVEQNQVIALVGSSGNSTGPHLHFEIIVDDQPIDPLLYLPRR